MISNQILQNTIDGLKDISKVDFCAFDAEGKVIAGTFGEPNRHEKNFALFERSFVDGQEAVGCRFFKIYDGGKLEYILLARGNGEEAHMAGKMAAFQIKSLLAAYKDRYDTDNFIKNLLLDNLLPVDIYNSAKKLHIDTDVERVVYIIETPDRKDNDAAENVKALIGRNPKDFVTAVDGQTVVLLKGLSGKGEARELKKNAEKMLGVLRGGGGPYLRIAYGTAFDDIRQTPRSYSEAKLALDVSRIFFKDRDITAYSSLGIGRLIYQLPIPLCKIFIKEVFEGKTMDDFNRELLLTVNKFFENSLNVSKTSRQLYIHRNTLVYRLDKLQKASGLDIRQFEDAITFKIALMVVQYMKYMESLEH